MTILVTWQLTITVHCSHMQWGSKFVKMGTQWGLIFEWNGDLIETCDIWDTDYNTDNWEPGLMTIFVTWQLIVTLDSIRNSCDVLNTWRIDSFNTRTPKNECGNSCPLPSKKGNTGSWFIRLFVGEGGKPCHMFKFSPSDQNWQYLQGPLPDSQSWSLSTAYQAAFCWEKAPSFPEQPGRESPQGSLQNIAIVPNSGSGS